MGQHMARSSPGQMDPTSGGFGQPPDELRTHTRRCTHDPVHECGDAQRRHAPGRRHGGWLPQGDQPRHPLRPHPRQDRARGGDVRRRHRRLRRRLRVRRVAELLRPPPAAERPQPPPERRAVLELRAPVAALRPVLLRAPRGQVRQGHRPRPTPRAHRPRAGPGHRRHRHRRGGQPPLPAEGRRGVRRGQDLRAGPVRARPPAAPVRDPALRRGLQPGHRHRRGLPEPLRRGLPGQALRASASRDRPPGRGVRRRVAQGHPGLERRRQRGVPRDPLLPRAGHQRPDGQGLHAVAGARRAAGLRRPQVAPGELGRQARHGPRGRDRHRGLGLLPRRVLRGRRRDPRGDARDGEGGHRGVARIKSAQRTMSATDSVGGASC